mmetsp:Transcript_62270/g.146812  ORF Transcript_62270/g.146812 Transcript_62270/m.146812 type:complete len:320 (-) Transcript_62270:26-985(-)
MALASGERGNGFWYEEQVTKELLIKAELRAISFDGQSEFQRIQVIDTVTFGKTLILDDHTQSSAVDEHPYHETLVHPALMAHGAPKTIFIGGGGEGATARECLRWKSVEKVVMCDLDKIACEECRDKLPEWSEGVYEDPRFEIHYEDALAFLRNWDGPKFDVIIMDISDPIECGPGIALYFKEFYEETSRTKMTEGGVFVTQSGACGLLNWHEVFSTIHSTCRSSFKHAHGFFVEIPSYGCPWGFNLCYNNAAFPQPQDWDPKEVDARLSKSIKDIETKPMHAYDGMGHRGMFNLPKWVRDGLAKETRVMTAATPVFLT